MKPWILRSLVASMLLTGTFNTLLNKYQDMVCVEDCSGPNKKTFEQPLLQTLNMFVGELMCLMVYYWSTRNTDERVSESETESLISNIPAEDAVEDQSERVEVPSTQQLNLEKSNYILFLIPTILDLTATTLMNIGLLFTSASVYQMLRGSVSIFTAIITRMVIGTKHPIYKWMALILVFAGVCLVGYSGTLIRIPTDMNIDEQKNANLAALGVGLVILAQIFTSSQFVFEEIVLSKYQVEPSLAVGLEGFFGTVIMVTVIPTLHFLFGDQYEIFNIYKLYCRITRFDELTITPILVCALGISLSIAVFNYCGISVTKNLTATSRSTIDTCRTIFIWMISLILGWEHFQILQVFGFSILVYGYY